MAPNDVQEGEEVLIGGTTWVKLRTELACL